MGPNLVVEKLPVAPFLGPHLGFKSDESLLKGTPSINQAGVYETVLNQGPFKQQGSLKPPIARPGSHYPPEFSQNMEETTPHFPITSPGGWRASGSASSLALKT